MPIMNIKAKPKTGAAKPAAAKKTTPAKRTSAKPATKTGARRTAAKTTPAKKTTSRKPAAAKKETNSRPVVSEAVLKKHIAALTKGRARLEKAQIEHDEASRGAHELAQVALEAHVPMKIVSETIGMSRQYLYKGYKGTRATKESRAASNGAVKKPAARRTTAKPATSSKATPAKKTTGSRPKIRVGKK